MPTSRSTQRISLRPRDRQRSALRRLHTGPNPGHCGQPCSDVAVDLMVAPHQAGTTKASARAARLTLHEKLTARIARGLEPALVDNAFVTITALEPSDSRTVELRVAGPAALLTAKAIKISERLEQADNRPDRLKRRTPSMPSASSKPSRPRPGGRLRQPPDR